MHSVWEVDRDRAEELLMGVVVAACAVNGAHKPQMSVDTMTPKDFCLRGHNINEVGRYSNGECRQCARRRIARWKEANPHKVLAEAKARRDAYRSIFGVSYVPNRHRNRKGGDI
jgi:hypothetical protein